MYVVRWILLLFTRHPTQQAMIAIRKIMLKIDSAMVAGLEFPS